MFICKPTKIVCKKIKMSNEEKEEANNKIEKFYSNAKKINNSDVFL